MKTETTKRPVVVVAVGGNALVPDNDSLRPEMQRQNAELAAKHVVDMIEEGWGVVLTHGNGPQVGLILRRSEVLRDSLPVTPVDLAVGDTQGEIGYMLQNALGNEIKRRKLDIPVVSVVTQVVIDEKDPAFANPDKPIGAFMEESEAKGLAEKEGWVVQEDSGRGWRRVIASPKPVRIVELDAIKHLVQQGVLVVCCGGGGVPVVEGTQGALSGVEAVIDKDRVSAVLAETLNAELLLIPTGVEKIALNFGKPDQKWLEEITLSEANEYLEEGHFGAGSMGPKVEAIIEYMKGRPGGQGLVTSLDKVKSALKRETGTWIVPNPA
ncbi:carbamate kinase [Microvirga sp. W0021]|uniref:Carbamate kinase n=1 Tax=Hohaiivirga grylli TaxID=3133970 RepID=A0ABV0BG22_9HYPH